MLRAFITAPTASIFRRTLSAFRLAAASPAPLYPSASTVSPRRAASNESRYEDSTANPIPVYAARPDETPATQRARLVYQSRKRGTLENGLLLSTFAARHLAGFTPAQLCAYDKLINEPSNEWDIYYWMVGAKEVPPEYESDVMGMLKEHASNRNNEARICQPALER